MRRLSVPILILLLLQLYSCNEQDEIEYELKPVDQVIRIKVDNLTSNVSEWLDYYYDEDQDSGLLFSLDPTQNELELYSIKQGGLIHKVGFDEEGPQGVGRLSGISVLNLNTILIYPPFDNTYFDFNLKSEVLEQSVFQKPDDYSSIRSVAKFFRSIPTIVNGYLYTKTFFGGNYLLLSNEELSSKPLMYRIDQQSGAMEFSTFTYPDDYWLEGKRHFEFSNVVTPNKFVFSFFGDHNIYFAESFNSKLKMKPAKSKYLEEEFEDLPLDSDRNKRRMYFASTAHYGSLLYDSYRDVYYRFCFPKKEVDSDESIQEVVQFPTKFSVMILNSELEVVGESLISQSGSEYVASNAFVGPAGLFISMNHPNNEFNQEDSFAFKLFEMKLTSN